MKKSDIFWFILILASVLTVFVAYAQPVLQPSNKWHVVSAPLTDRCYVLEDFEHKPVAISCK